MINKKKIIAGILSIISIIQIFFISNKSIAASVGDTSYLERAEKGFYTIQKWNGEEWIYVTYSITNYVDENGQKKVAYCVDPDLKGIGYISGEFSGYDVELKNLITDEKCWRALKNGYPYKSASELGVETDQDAYLATKMALYAMLRGNTESDIRSLYRPGEDRVAGQDKNETWRRGEKVINAICNLVNIGNNGTETMKYTNNLSIQTIGSFTEYQKDKNYYYQSAKVVSNVECTEYIVKGFSGFPEGTKITNINGIEQSTFKGGDEFRIMVPKKAIMENITGCVAVTGACRNYPIYYAECKEGNYQNYMLCCDSLSKNVEAEANINIEINKSKLKIVKVDKNDKKALAGVKFSIKYKNGQDIGTYTTDENGIINIDNLHQGQIVVKEVESARGYELMAEEKVIDIGYDESKEILFENELKKSKIKVIKVDADNNQIRIEGAKFEIYDESGNLINTIVTDKNGEAKVEGLPINKKYTIKEVETAKEYILSNDVVTVELKENEIKSITFKNKKKQVANQTLPRTGLVNYNLFWIVMAIGCMVSKRFIQK
ncbi:MAG: Cys-Gln thioester bond-forming surface protein [Clostridia bacterium]|nr:Cys-Gln thioester bond-forming surface protein [Clostridia bacterium]